MNGVEMLCVRCGLCCDGTLFADVELRRGDDPQALRKLEMPLFEKRPGKWAFAQSCQCFDGTHCRIYEDRPRRCRTFECGLLKKLDKGEVTASEALRKIASAKRLARKTWALLAAEGHPQGGAPLSHSYREAMAAPVDLSDPEAADRRGELMMAANELMQWVQRHFLA